MYHNCLYAENDNQSLSAHLLRPNTAHQLMQKDPQQHTKVAHSSNTNQATSKREPVGQLRQEEPITAAAASSVKGCRLAATRLFDIMHAKGASKSSRTMLQAQRLNFPSSGQRACWT
jgi:hypothetical protein